MIHNNIQNKILSYRKILLEIYTLVKIVQISQKSSIQILVKFCYKADQFFFLIFFLNDINSILILQNLKIRYK